MNPKISTDPIDEEVQRLDQRAKAILARRNRARGRAPDDYEYRAVEPRERFAENLRRHRARRGLSQEALGHACGLHRTEVSLLERAGRDPRLSTIVRLARALGISAAELMKDVG